MILEDVGFLHLTISLIFCSTLRLPYSIFFFLCLCFIFLSILFTTYYYTMTVYLDSQNHITYQLELLLDSGYFFLFMALSLIFAKVFSFYLLPFFLIPYIILILVRLCIPERRQNITNNRYWAIFEAIQILLISLYIKGHFVTVSIHWITAILMLNAIFHLVASILSFFAFGGLYFFFNNIPHKNERTRDKAKIFVHSIFRRMWKGIVFFELTIIFKHLLTKHKFHPGAKMHYPHFRLKAVCIVMFFFATIDLIITLILQSIWKKYLSLKLLNIEDPNERLTSKILAKKGFDLSVFNFDKKNEEVIQNSLPNLKCFDCYQKKSETIVRPCGHGGLCKDCMLLQLKKRNQCPFCRDDITKVDILEFNKDSGKYQTVQNMKVRKIK